MTLQRPADRVVTVAVAGFVALLFSGAPLLTYTQSLFLAPMTREFGWTKTQYFLPLAISGMAAALLVPLIGRAADRHGVRRLLIPGIVLFAGAYALLGVIGNSLVQYGAILLSATIFQSAHGVLLYAKAVALWPTQRLALMFSIALSGAAAGGIIVPPLTATLIEQFGWRDARFALAALVLLVSLPVAFAFVRPPASRAGGPLLQAEPSGGVPMRVAIRTKTFWAILAIVGLSGAAINAMVANLVPILADQNFSAAGAAACLSIVAGSQLVGRLVSGLVIDRSPTPLIALPLLLFPLTGVVLLGLHPWTPLVLLAVALLGVGLGAEMEMAAFFTRRYFGAANFAQIYGYVLMLYILGANVGPLVLGTALDSSAGSGAALAVAGAFLVSSVLALLILPSYPGHGEIEGSIPVGYRD